MSVKARGPINISKQTEKNRNVINSNSTQKYSREQGIKKRHRMRFSDFQNCEVYFPNHRLGPSVFSFYFDSVSSLNKFDILIPCNSLLFYNYFLNV